MLHGSGWYTSLELDHNDDEYGFEKTDKLANLLIECIKKLVGVYFMKIFDRMWKEDKLRKNGKMKNNLKWI